MGFGIKDVDYKVHIAEKVNGKWLHVWRCPYYRKWESMLYRCFSKKYQEKQPSYIGCQVFADWKYFSKFRGWCILQEQLLGISVQNFALDKDIL